MRPYQERIVIEQAELQQKIDALAAFIEGPHFFEVIKDEDERNMLYDQEVHMRRYNRILLKRIKNFKGE